MISPRLRSALLASAVVSLAIVGVQALSQQRSEPPIARYTMDVGTLSGMAAMGAGGNGVGAAMAMLRGGGDSTAHEIILRLGSSRAASGAPKADHFPPKGAELGASLPLVTPRQGAVARAAPGEAQPQQMPRGKLMLYWGCGEHAGPGQPVVIDFAKLAKGQVPAGLYAQSPNLPDDWRVAASNSTTYGDWPNSESTAQAGKRSSLLGKHRIAGNYSPEISFDLDTDYMAPVNPRTAPMASGAYSMSWPAVAGATGYYSWLMSAKTDSRGEAAEMVWWTSSATQQFGGPMWDWLAPSTVARLVDAKTVMPPSQTSCTVPAEVKQAGGEVMMANLTAYGPERSFAYPARPADPKVTWKPEWITRVRFRSNTMFMLGMPDMGGMGSGGAGDTAEGSGAASPEPGKPKCKGGLAGMAARAAGLCK